MRHITPPNLNIDTRRHSPVPAASVSARTAASIFNNSCVIKDQETHLILLPCQSALWSNAIFSSVPSPPLPSPGTPSPLSPLLLSVSHAITSAPASDEEGERNQITWRAKAGYFCLAEERDEGGREGGRERERERERGEREREAEQSRLPHL